MIIDRIYKGKESSTRVLSVTKDGTDNAPIIWQGSGTVILDGEDRMEEVVEVGWNGVHHTLRNLIITRARDVGVMIYGSNYTTLENLTITYCGVKSGTGMDGRGAVSYTHLTLPTN